MNPFRKSLYCSNHDQKVAFFCLNQACTAKQICEKIACISDHFHQEGILKIQKIQENQLIKQKLLQVEKVLRIEDYTKEAKYLKSFIDELKNTMVQIYKQCKELHQVKESLQDKPLKLAEVESTIQVGQSLQKNIDFIKTKLNLNSDESKDKALKTTNCKKFPLSSQQDSKDEKNAPIIQKDLIIQEKAQKTQVTQNSNVDQFEELFKSSNTLNVISKKENQNSGLPSNQLKQNTISREEQDPESMVTKPINLQKMTQFRALIQQINYQPRPAFTQKQPAQILKIYERDFGMKKQLTMLLEKNIQNFSWGMLQQIFNPYNLPNSAQSFHQKLEGMRNMLFIFITEQKQILGSFYRCSYPRMAEKMRNDVESFIFVSQSNVLYEFKAIHNEFHLSVSANTYISHGTTQGHVDGIKSIKHGISEIQYFMPSLSYKPVTSQASTTDLENSSRIKEVNGIAKIKEFYVLQYLGKDNYVNLD